MTCRAADTSIASSRKWLTVSSTTFQKSSPPSPLRPSHSARRSQDARSAASTRMKTRAFTSPGTGIIIAPHPPRARPRVRSRARSRAA